MVSHEDSMRAGPMCYQPSGFLQSLFLLTFVFSDSWRPTDTLSGVLYFLLSAPRLLAMRIRDIYKYSSRTFFKTIILHIIKSRLNTDNCRRRYGFTPYH
jgi:hypothetical protein